MTRTEPTRRRVLRLAGLTIAASALAGCSSSAGPDDESPTDGSDGGDAESDGGDVESFDGWFDDTDNYDGVADETGSSAVTVAVGSGADGFRFDPPAVAVSTGTTVTWEWTGDGGSHNVVADDGSFESQLTDEAGHTFEHGFDATGTYRYYCNPHKAMGMKGVVVVE